MRNTKITSLILALILIISSCFSLLIFAEETVSTPTVDIVAKNIIYEDQIKIAFAAEASDSAAEIEVIYYTEDPALNANATAYTASVGTSEVYGKMYYTHGVSAKDLADSVWAKAHIVETEIYSDVVEYSVAEYLYSMLYKHGAISATEGEALDEKNFYESLLTYGSNAQTVLVNNKKAEDETAETLVKDYYYAYVQDGTLDGSENSAIFDSAVGATVTLKYTGTDSSVVGWNVTTYTSSGTATEKVATNATVTLTGNTVITPAYLETLTVGETFDDLTELKGDGTDSNVKFGKTTCAAADLGTVQEGDEIKIVKDPTNENNNVLMFKDGSTGSGIYSSLYIATSGSLVANGVTVFETKLYIPSDEVLSTSIPAQPGFASGRTVVHSENLNMYSDKSQVYFTLDDTTGSETGRAITTDAWHVLRLEYYNTASTDTATVKVYIDNLYAGSMASTNVKDVNTFFWKGYSSGLTTIYFDNISLTEKALPTE